MADEGLSSDGRKDLLANFGASPNDVYETDADISEEAEEEQVESAEEAPEEVEAAASEEDEEIEVEVPEGEEEEEAEEVDYAGILQSAREKLDAAAPAETASEQSELDRLRQQVRDLEGALTSRVAEVEGKLKAPESEEAPSELDFSSPQMVALLQEELGVDEETARKAARVYSGVAKLTVEQVVGKKFKELDSRTEEISKTREQEKLEARRQNNLMIGLQHAKAMGGLEAEVVSDAYQNGRDSLLARHMKKFPFKMDSPELVLDSILSVARGAQVMHAGKAPSQTPAKVSGSKDVVTAALESRKRRPQKPKEEKSAEDEILQGILDAEPKLKKLPKGFYG